MKRKFVSIGLAALLAVSLLAGCGGKGAAETGSTGDTKAVQEADNTGNAETTGGGTGEQVTINFQTWNPGEGAAIDEVIAAFEEKYPNIKVNHVYMPYTDHVEKLKIDLASGEGADVFGMQTGATIKEFRDFEMDLTSYAEES